MGLFPKDRNLSEASDHVRIGVRASAFRRRADELEIRLDAFLQHHLHWRSRSSIQRLIRDGFVRVGGNAPEKPSEGSGAIERKAGRLLRDGACVTVRIPDELVVRPLDGAPQELAVLFEDENLVAVDKPPLLPVHPSGRHLSGTLIQLLHARYAPAGGGAALPVRLCHRLDRETSGLVLAAKNERAHRFLALQFERRQIRKEYLAIVRGVPEAEGGTIDLPLGQARTSAVHLKMAVVSDGLPSRTEWSVLERYRACALVSCRPLTGRQHQIRVHLDAIGHPLVGDKLYGVDEATFLRHAAGALGRDELEELGLGRHALHNHRLAFRSPTTREVQELVCPLAADLRALLERSR